MEHQASALTVERDVVIIPSSLWQRRIWVSHQANPNCPSHNVGVRGRIEGPIDCDLIRSAVTEVIERHEVLRTSFRENKGCVEQVIESKPLVRFELIDLSSDPAQSETARERMDKLALQETRRPFNLCEPGLLRVVLLRAGSTESMLLLTSHLIAVDGWSMGLILSELADAYTRHQAGQVAKPLPDLQYADYTVWQNDWLGTVEARAQRAFWRARLAGVQLTRLPPVEPQTTTDPFDSDITSTMLPQEVAQAIRDLAREEETTLFVVSLTVVLLLLARRTGQDEIVIGTQLSCRDRIELEKVVGPLSNCVVLRTRIDRQETVRQMVSRVKTELSDVLANQALPFEAVLESTSAFQESACIHRIPINFLTQRGFIRPAKFGEALFTPVPSKSQGAVFDLGMGMVERADGWRVSCEYRKCFYPESFAANLVHDIVDVATEITTQPDRPVNALVPAPSDSNAGTGCSDTTALTYAPASPAQGRFWTLWQIWETTANLCALFRIKGQIDADLLSTALRQVIARHDVLRTSFEPRGDGIVQTIATGSMSQLIISDLRDVRGSDDEIARLLREQADWKFDLTRRPLIRALLVRVTPEESLFCIAMPHIISDGWSGGVLFQELRETYRGLAAREPVKLAPVTVQFGDHAAWMRDWTQSESVQQGLEYWSERLAGPLPIVDVPTDHPVKGGQRGLACKEVVEIPADIVTAAKRFCREMQATPFMVFLAAFKALLFRYSGSHDILVGSTVANRDAQTQNVLGPFANPICLRTALTACTRFQELVQAVKSTTLDALDRQNIPFELVLPRVNARLVRGRSPLFQFYFLYQTAFVQSFELCGATFTALPAPSGRATCEMQLQLVERAEGLFAQLEYDSALYSPATARLVLAHYRNLLKSALAQGAQAIDDLEVLSNEERDDVQSGSRRHALTAALMGKLSSPMAEQLEEVVDVPGTASAVTGHSVSAAQSTVEPVLAAIVCDVLKIDKVRADDDLFDLGCHSMSAMSIVTLMNARFGVQLPVRVLFEARTVRKLTELIHPCKGSEADAGDAWPVLIPIQSAGTRTPLFCISRPNVNALGYVFLSRELGQEQPVYGLQSQLEEDPAIDFTQEQYVDTAEEYVKAMRTVQPNGPYHLIGLCQGAYIAFEMARQLNALGEQVGLLGVLDTWTEENTRHRWLFRCYQIWTAFHQRPRQLWKHLWCRVHPARATEPAAAAVKPALRNGLTMQQKYWPGADFRPVTYTGAITVFRTRKQKFFRIHDEALGWGSRAEAGVVAQMIPGNHATMLRPPHVKTLAQKIKQSLATFAKTTRAVQATKVRTAVMASGK